MTLMLEEIGKLIVRVRGQADFELYSARTKGQSS